MATSSRAGTPKKAALSASAVGVGLAGAVAGAAMGVAFADEKTRRKIYKLAQDAQGSLMKLLDSLEISESELPKKVEMLAEKNGLGRGQAAKKARTNKTNTK